MKSDTYDRDLALMQKQISILRCEVDQADEIHADEVDDLYRRLAEALNEIAVLKKQLRMKRLS